MVGPVRTTSRWARERFTAALVARLATVDDHMQPHIVPFVFAVIDDVIYSAVDGKPKSGQPLRRLDNIAHNPRVSALVNHYADDWNDLWWARADGTARLVNMDSEEATRRSSRWDSVIPITNGTRRLAQCSRSTFSAGQAGWLRKVPGNAEPARRPARQR